MAVLAQISFISEIMYANLSARSQRQGLLSRLGMDDGFERKGAPPDYGAAGLGPWTFRVGGVDLLGWSFVW